jgi:Cysteine rich repeat
MRHLPDTPPTFEMWLRKMPRTSESGHWRALTSQAARTFILPSGMKAVQMFRISYIFLLALMAAQVFAISAVSAQQGHDACARDVSRFCRAQMNEGDSVVLGCLKQHRARLSRACDKVLTDNGQ